jgi:hypothetical protein
VAPDLAVVFAAGGDADSVEAMLSRLRSQTLAARLEVVIVARDRADAVLAPDAARGFFDVRVVDCRKQALLGEALAVGTAAAKAPYVALIEDHCFPDAAWAEALLRRHEKGYAAVGPEIANANPDSIVSWCSFLSTHAGWSAPAAAGEVDSVAGDNSSYRRDLLLGLGDELGTLLGSGTVLHAELRAAGHRIFLEPAAKATHVTPSRLGSMLGSRFFNGRAFAGLWSRRFTLARRVSHALGAPLIALRGAWRVVRAGGRQAEPVNVPALAAVALLAWPFSTAGYVLGFVLGPGDAARFSSDLYFRRDAHLSAGDAALSHAVRARSVAEADGPARRS